ncbi:ParB/RepB/Spo0J family partition protein [Niveispirillum sp.]|uniref:ParB/RepB/Spo0J family partition protein n=1 Tax=Niveispirillum sp. TaxID=1917217 RepID=UPI001B539BC6|nr:ParB/RepB/Spo0J family partition protein [Niveispirillum sp.]MBP7338835.1 ParB/RepB/Spo0J family partition protein [Niveispirillum sp.]
MSSILPPTAGDTRGTYLRRLREAAGMSGRELDAAARISIGSVAHVEAGKRTNIGDAIYTAIAAALSVDPSAVLALPVVAPAEAEPARAILPMGAALPRRAVRPSPLNPRKRFDPEQLAELGESIRTAGIIEPILVRPIEAEPGAYWIVAGERRWRALETFLTGANLDNYMVPVVIREGMTDEDHLKLAIIENLQRVDVAPLEEAAAFDQLEFMGLSKKAIASAIGKVPEYVQQRIRLVKRLCPEAQAALADRKINFTQALHMTSVDHVRQRDLLKKLDRYPTAERMRDAIYGDMVPISRAIFDLDGFDACPIVENPVTGLRYFASRDAFHTRQKEAVEALKARYLAEGWSWVDTGSFMHCSGYEDQRSDDRTRAGVFITYSTWDGVVGHIHEGLVIKDLSTPDHEREAIAERNRVRQAAHEEFMRKLRSNLKADHEMLLRLLFVDMLAQRFEVQDLFNPVHGGRMDAKWVQPNPLAADGGTPLIPPLAKLVDEHLSVDVGRQLVEMKSGGRPDDRQVSILAALHMHAVQIGPALMDIWAHEMVRRLDVSAYRSAPSVILYLARVYRLAVPPHLQPAQTDIEDAANAVRDDDAAEAAE